MIASNILKGLLEAQDFASFAASVPCDIVNELETNVEAADQFIEEIQAGEVPTIIKDLPEEVVGAFQSILGVALQLPGAIWDTATDLVDGAEDVFDDLTGAGDGSIVDDIGALPGVAATEAAELWDGVADGFVEGW